MALWRPWYDYVRVWFLWLGYSYVFHGSFLYMLVVMFLDLHWVTPPSAKTAWCLEFSCLPRVEDELRRLNHRSHLIFVPFSLAASGLSSEFPHHIIVRRYCLPSSAATSKANIYTTYSCITPIHTTYMRNLPPREYTYPPHFNPRTWSLAAPHIVTRACISFSHLSMLLERSELVSCASEFPNPTLKIVHYCTEVYF
jgi:hypothetical protein